MIETDGPAHARLRRIVSSAFTPRKVKDYAAYTREIARGLLDEAVAKESFDWVEGVAAPLPINVIVSILGISDEDAEMMIELSNHLAEGTSDIPSTRPLTATRPRCACCRSTARLRGHCSSMRAGSARNAGRT